MAAAKITPEIEKIIIDLYTNSKLGAPAISDLLLEDYGIELHRSPIGKHIKKLIASGDLKKISAIEKAGTIAQRGFNYGKTPNNYREVLRINDNSRLRYPGRYPEEANFKVQIREDGKTTMRYFNTAAEAKKAIADTSIIPVDPKNSKDKKARTRTASLKEVTKGSSAADKANIKTIKGGIAKLNLYFKNDPELINNSNFGKNIKSMLALRLDKNSGNPYSKLQSDSYYLTKAKQGQLFDLFDVNPVAGKKRGGRYSTNVNVTPNTFNRAFVGAQLTAFFNKGVNKDTADNLDKMFKDMNVRVDLPNAGKIGAEAGVGFDSKTGRFPTIDKTLKILGAEQKVRDFFIQKNNLIKLAGSNVNSICSLVKTGNAAGGPAGCAAEISQALDEDPVGMGNKIKNLKVEGGAVNRIKGAASAFLKFAGKGKVFGATAAVGVGAGALVKKFMNDDPDTYLTNDAQANAMILDTIDEKERQERMEAIGDAPELLDEARIAGEVGVTAAAIPGSGAVYGARKKPFTRMVDGVKKTRPAMGTARAALGPVGKALSGFATPAGIAALTPLNVASSLYEGDSGYEIATDPLNYLAPAFAGTLSKEATRGMGAASKLSKSLRLGMSPGAIKMVSRRFGLPGLALSGGISLYELADDYKMKRGMFGKKE